MVGARAAVTSYGSGQAAVSEEWLGEAGLDLAIESRAGETVQLWRSDSQGAENAARPVIGRKNCAPGRERRASMTCSPFVGPAEMGVPSMDRSVNTFL